MADNVGLVEAEVVAAEIELVAVETELVVVETELAVVETEMVAAVAEVVGLGSGEQFDLLQTPVMDHNVQYLKV